MLSRRLSVLAVTAALLGGAAPGLAQTNPAPAAEPAKTQWRLTVGAGGMVAPTYLGSDEYDFDALPLFDLRYADRAFLSTRDGLGANLLRGPNLKAGPILKFRFGRDQDDDAALRGLGNVDPAWEAGGFVRYDLKPMTLGAELRQGMGGHDGTVGDLFASWSTNLSRSVMLTAGPRASFGSEDYTQTYFGIDAGQAARSGYSRYNADGLFASFGLGAAVNWRMTDSLSLGGFAGVDRILGDAANSPIVDQAGSATQGRVGVTLGYTFGR